MYEPKIIEINIDSIKEKISTHRYTYELQRREFCWETVGHYVENIDEILEEKPVEVCELRGEFYLVNGYHRIAAYRKVYPDATTIRAEVRLVEAVNAVIIRSGRANFNNGKPLSTDERRKSVKMMSKAMEYAGISESEYVDQLVEITKLPRKSILRYTEEQRLEIKNRLARAVSVKRLSGLSLRKTAEALGVTRHVVEYANKQNVESPFTPFPGDVDTQLTIQVMFFCANEWETSMIEVHQNFSKEAWWYELGVFSDNDIARFEVYREAFVPLSEEAFNAKFPASNSVERDKYSHLRLSCLSYIQEIRSRKEEAEKKDETIEDRLLEIDQDAFLAATNPAEVQNILKRDSKKSRLRDTASKLAKLIAELGVDEAREHLNTKENSSIIEALKKVC